MTDVSWSWNWNEEVAGDLDVKTNEKQKIGDKASSGLSGTSLTTCGEQKGLSS